MTDTPREVEEERASAAPELTPLPWDAIDGRPLQAFWVTLRGCLLHPFDAFRRVALSEDRWSALGYAILMHLVGFTIGALWTAVLERELLTLALIRVAIAPLWVLVSVWLGSEVMHGLLGLLGERRLSRAVTHRAVAYCYSTAALGVIPLWGLRAGLAAAMIYQIIALRQAHQIKSWKAIAVVLITWGLLIGSLLLAAVSGEPLDDQGS